MSHKQFFFKKVLRGICCTATMLFAASILYLQGYVVSPLLFLIGILWWVEIKAYNTLRRAETTAISDQVFSRISDFLQSSEIQTDALIVSSDNSFLASVCHLYDGQIVVIFGARVAYSTSELEVAGICAHELGHLKFKDALVSTLLFSSLFIFLCLVNVELFSKFGNSYSLLITTSLLLGLGLQLVDAAYDQFCEKRADAFSVYYSKGNGLLTWLTYEYSDEAMATPPVGLEKLNRFFTHHPHPYYRVRALNKAWKKWQAEINPSSLL